MYGIADLVESRRLWQFQKSWHVYRTFTLSASQTKALWNLEVAVEEQAYRRQRQGHKRIKVLNT